MGGVIGWSYCNEPCYHSNFPNLQHTYIVRLYTVDYNNSEVPDYKIIRINELAHKTFLSKTRQHKRVTDKNKPSVDKEEILSAAWSVS